MSRSHISRDYLQESRSGRNIPHFGAVQLGAVVPFVAITVLLLLAIACTSSSLPSARTPLPTTSLAPTPLPTPNSTPDLEREAIISFTLQALEIEGERNDLIAYFAGLRDSVGIHGQAFAIERFFSKGIPATLSDAPASGFEGMTTLRNRLLLLDSPQSIQPVKDALIYVYDSELQQALNQIALVEMSGFALPGEYYVGVGERGASKVQVQSSLEANWGGTIRELVYPEITRDNLDYWRQLVEQSEVGPAKNLYKHKVETVWFGLQEFRQQIYVRWVDILQEHGIDTADAGVTIKSTEAKDYRQTPGSINEEVYGPYSTYLNVLGIGVNRRTIKQIYEANRAQPLHDVFRMQQRVGIFLKVSGVGGQPNWEAYVQLHSGTNTELLKESERILRGISGMTPEKREQTWMAFEPGAPGNLEELQDLLRQLVLAAAVRD